MSCIIESELRSSTFTIFPVEIVIGGRKTGFKTKRVITRGVINVLPRCSKLVASQEKRTLRKIVSLSQLRKYKNDLKNPCINENYLILRDKPFLYFSEFSS